MTPAPPAAGESKQTVMAFHEAEFERRRYGEVGNEPSTRRLPAEPDADWLIPTLVIATLASFASGTVISLVGAAALGFILPRRLQISDLGALAERVAASRAPGVDQTLNSRLSHGEQFDATPARVETPAQLEPSDPEVLNVQQATAERATPGNRETSVVAPKKSLFGRILAMNIDVRREISASKSSLS